MVLTSDCLITHIKNIQNLYKDLVNEYVENLKIGKKCPEMELNMLIINSYLKTLYCWTIPTEYINRYRLTVVFQSTGINPTLSSLSFDLDNGTDSTPFVLTGTPYHTLLTTVNGIVSDLEDLGFDVSTESVSSNTYYIYISSTDTIYEGITITNETHSTTTAFFSIAMIDNGSVAEADVVTNCLTNDEVCAMIGHTYELFEECDC